jgi:NADH dehydrogenase FAD-containing subunit
MTTPQPPKNIIILGGSYAGISTAHHTLKHTLPFLPSSTSYQIILISTSSQALCRPACPRALLSDSMFPQDKLFVDVAEQFQHYPQDIFRFVHGSATAVDHVKRTVAYELVSTGETQVLEFFALVVATGASTPSPLMGFNSNDAKGLRECWEEIRAKLKEAKSIVVAGGGPTGVETAGELGEFLNGRAGMFGGGLKDRKVRITLVTAGTQILPALRPALAETAEGYLKKVGVEVVKDTRIVSVEPEDAGTREGGLTKRVTLKLSRGQGIEADL